MLPNDINPFGATNIVKYGNLKAIFKVLAQIHHLIGSLLAVPEQDPQFLQIYFIDNVEKEIDRRCTFSVATDRGMVSELQTLFHDTIVGSKCIYNLSYQFIPIKIMKSYQNMSSIHSISILLYATHPFLGI